MRYRLSMAQQNGTDKIFLPTKKQGEYYATVFI